MNQRTGNLLPEASVAASADDLIGERVDSHYSVRLGERIRSFRRQKFLALQDVYRISEGEFKSSVLGAYERGDRAVSFPRLCRLAEVYGVPVDVMLPRTDTNSGLDPSDRDAESAIAINIRQLVLMTGDAAGPIATYVRGLQIRRQDFNGAIITLREADAEAIAAMLRVPRHELVDRLEDLGLLAS